ncbi:MAG: C69 family dipeptidase [Candidatus Eisenbacteria sp.]|nr:C69 family dipeptidase [Candidatus Eisenbacteria bacterium]
MILALGVLSACAGSGFDVQACSSLLVSRGASADGSVIITYTCDGEFHPHLRYRPAADHEPGDSLEISDWGGKVRGRIPQVPHTHAVVGLMNEHQLAIGETTFGGREELINPDGLFHYWDLMKIALQRARTAREAIDVMTGLVAQYGYRSGGETFSIADPEEAWIMEMIGPGPGRMGAAWVAWRIPDGALAFHANKARIGDFPRDDPERCGYSDLAVSLAIEKGYYDPASGEPFRFCEAYDPATPQSLRYCEARVWSAYRRAAPSQDFSADYHRAVPGARPYPLWIEPDERLAVEDVFALMRDHYEGTPLDMTQGIDAGPYGTPNRWRPLTWSIDSVEYVWERPISTQQTGFSFISQSRNWLPDAIGGLYWYGVDDTYTTCYVPLYCGIDRVPESYTTGRLDRFSWDSAWWVFNFVANFANLRYSMMLPEIQAVQTEIEGRLRVLQPAVEQTALALAESDPDLMTRYLTNYAVMQGEQTVARWRELGEHLITKFNDGYVQREPGEPEDGGYPESWLREVVRVRPERFRLPERPADVPESRLVD